MIVDYTQTVLKVAGYLESTIRRMLNFNPIQFSEEDFNYFQTELD